MTTQAISVSIKTVYGNQKIYPISESAKTFSKLLGQSTLTKDNIKYIKELGYTVSVVQESLEEL